MQVNRLITGIAALLLLAGCGTQRTQPVAPRPPAEVKAEIVRLLPARTVDRQGWATDIYAAFAAQGIEPSTQNLCSVLAVTEQESTFQVDPPVPGLGAIGPEWRVLAANPARVREAHEARRRVYPWTVNTRPALDFLTNLGVDGVISDRLDLFDGAK